MRFLALFVSFGLLLICLSACASGAKGSGSGSVTGTVSYRERIALPPNSEIEVKLLDVSQTGAPALVVGEQIISGAGSVPVKFAIRYDPARIQDDHRYAITARITNAGKVLWRSDASVPVITQGNPDRVDVMLVLFIR